MAGMYTNASSKTYELGNIGKHSVTPMFLLFMMIFLQTNNIDTAWVTMYPIPENKVRVACMGANWGR